MAKRSRVTLRRAGGNCEQVVLPTTTQYGNPIGSVCAVPGGYDYHSFPSPQVARGPVKTKAGAVLRVVRDYKSWIG
jgi:hypothetical protein